MTLCSRTDRTIDMAPLGYERLVIVGIAPGHGYTR